MEGIIRTARCAEQKEGTSFVIDFTRYADGYGFSHPGTVIHKKAGCYWTEDPNELLQRYGTKLEAS
jgi:hypothetical protein